MKTFKGVTFNKYEVADDLEYDDVHTYICESCVDHHDFENDIGCWIEEKDCYCCGVIHCVNKADYTLSFRETEENLTARRYMNTFELHSSEVEENTIIETNMSVDELKRAVKVMKRAKRMSIFDCMCDFDLLVELARKKNKTLYALEFESVAW